MKLKIMIADLDQDNIKNFRTYIKLSFPDIKIVPAPIAAVSLKEMVREHTPNIILADIRFFGALSYHIVRDIHEISPDVRFIIYGSYNDTEYIQKIMEFGVIDYIYKPVRTADLDKCLKHANDIFASIEADKAIKSTLQAEYQKNIEIFKTIFLGNLVYGNLSRVFEIETSIDYFKLNIKPNYTVMIARIDYFKKIILTIDEKDKHLLVYRMLMMIKNKLKIIENGTAFIHNFHEIVIILGNSTPLEQMVKLGNEIKSDIYADTKHNVTIGVGREYTNPADIYISYKEADAALRYRTYVGFNTVIPIHYVEPLNNITHRYPLVKEEVLVYSAVIGEYEYCEILLKQIIDALKNSGDLPEYLLSKIVMNIVISINRYASEQNITIGNEFVQFFPTKDIFNIKTLDEAYDYLSKSLKTFCDHVLKMRNENKHKIVADAVEYIKQNYAQNITITDISLSCNTTPEFLSTIFYQVHSQSINDFINKYRVEQSRGLIASTDSSDDVIAGLVGFSSVNLFRNSFRKYQGMYPQEYRLTAYR